MIARANIGSSVAGDGCSTTTGDPIQWVDRVACYLKSMNLMERGDSSVSSLVFKKSYLQARMECKMAQQIRP